MPFHRDRDSALFRRLFRLQAANKPATSWPRRWLHPGLTVDYTIEFARVLRGSSPDAAFSFLSGAGADPTGRSRMSFARYKGEAENALLTAGFPHVYLFRPTHICPMEPRREPNFSYRLLRAIYPAFSGGVSQPGDSGRRLGQSHGGCCRAGNGPARRTGL